nr:hypothetical protein HK105_002013 [Polyrhizophydium stewartii]
MIAPHWRVRRPPNRPSCEAGYIVFPWCKKYASNPWWGIEGKPYGWEDGRSCIPKDGRHDKGYKKGDKSHSKGCSSDHSTEYSNGEGKLQWMPHLPAHSTHLR